MARIPTPTVHAVLVIVPIGNDQFVFVQEAKSGSRGLWSLPGGMVESGENVYECAIREVKEEAGIVVEPRGHLLVEHLRYVTDVVDGPVEKLRHVVVAEYLSGELKQFEDLESIEARSFSCNDLRNLPLREASYLDWLQLYASDQSLLPSSCYQYRVI